MEGAHPLGGEGKGRAALSLSAPRVRSAGKNEADGVANGMMGARESYAVDRGQARIVHWRVARLERAGFDASLAGQLARDPRSDIHRLLELVDRGCPPHLAARILAPLDADGASS